ncbi:MAG: type II secretion system F family protein [Nitrospira sp.]|nr:type II secretion system F family protein [Nitrospira sp.]MCB9712198.1 type II secretion system F family protein [Nitrospiraceae bacterium]MDR4488037.1 type II secretion system F family protein [Nitrospirales bacterium]
MSRFHYKAARADGTIIENDIEGETERGIRTQLEGQGLLILNLSGSEIRALPRFSTSRKRGLSLREFLIFNQEFLALVKAGLPMLRCFDLLAERSTQAAFHQALQGVRESIRGGAAISEAMAQHTHFFPELYQASVRSGEQAGNLPEVLSRYISYLKLLIGVREKVLRALAYPAFLVVFGFGVVGFLLAYVLPSFSDVYSESRVELPWATQMLLNFINSASTWLPILLVGLAVSIGTFAWWRTTPSGKWKLDQIMLQVPLLGDIILKNQAIRLTRTLATILAGGIPLLTALQITGKAMTNMVLAHGIQSAIAQVREGNSLSNALKRGGFLPRMTVEMIEVGETTGSLETMLLEVAEFHEGELDLQLSRLTTWIEPLLLVLMGILVGGIVIIMYLPIFQLAGTT